MATVYRPLHSDFARGKTGGDIIFCDGENRQYTTSLGPKKGACTERQRYIRDLNKAAWARWRTLSPGIQANWNTGEDRRSYIRKEQKWHTPQKGVYLYVATYMHYHLYKAYNKRTKEWVWKPWDDNYGAWFV